MFGEQGKVRYAWSIECIRQDKVGEGPNGEQEMAENRRMETIWRTLKI